MITLFLEFLILPPKLSFLSFQGIVSIKSPLQMLNEVDSILGKEPVVDVLHHCLVGL
jgi:hypothetical protein